MAHQDNINNAETRLRLVLSGPGLIGRKHADLIAKSTRSRLIAIVAPPSDENRQYAKSMDSPLYTSLDDALDSGHVDGVIVASPTEFHAEQSCACIERGIPVLVEKPLTADLNSATRIWREAVARNVPVLVGHHRNYSSYLLEAARKFIASERFGELTAVQGAALFRKPESYFDAGPWRTKVGGGPIFINLIHEIGILRYLCGPIRAVSAIASHARRGFEVEDGAALCFRFEVGAIGTFILSDIAASDRSWEMTSGENPMYPRSIDADCYHIAGTNGSIDFPSLRARYYDETDEPSWWRAFRTERFATKPVDPLARQLAHFEAVIAGEVQPIVTAAEGVENIRVLEAVTRAIESGRTIELTPGGE